MPKEVIKVIFRKIGTRKDKRIIVFFPEMPVNSGNIMSYEHNGQHSEASYEFYKKTKKAKPEEYEELFQELKTVYSEYKLVIKQRLHYPTLEKTWERSKAV